MNFHLRDAAKRHVATHKLIPKLTKSQLEKERVTLHALSIDIVKLLDAERKLDLIFIELERCIKVLIFVFR